MKKLFILIPIIMGLLLSACKKEDEFVDEGPQKSE